MKSSSQPLVSIVTPVYNGEAYLADCIQSVLAQTYENWDYVIVNNCSSDGSLKIARKYAEKDPRIRIYENTEFLPIIANFNHAVRQISPKSVYCKILHSDDLMFDRCIEKMVAVAESNASVGIVGSYVLRGVRVVCSGLSYPQTVFSGKEVCRRSVGIRHTPGRIYVFGSPSSTLIKSSLIRDRNPLYNDKYHMCVDQELCYYLLQHQDFGFVHEILTHSRTHEQSVSTSINKHNREIIEELMLMQDFGMIYLEKKELEKRFEQSLARHYKFLSASIFHRKGKAFWEFHKKGFDRLDIRLNRVKLFAGALEVLANIITQCLFHPSLTWKKILTRWSQKQ